ncbi:phosphatidylserine/phosphatidylglycerophosphate/cardiolipin synthase-like enzyme [Paraburkholderia sp. GAS42]|jgi:phosphatidylserine/phosphatidylglycerophosphate/cardiolipin synthase-like enzyme
MPEAVAKTLRYRYTFALTRTAQTEHQHRMHLRILAVVALAFSIPAAHADSSLATWGKQLFSRTEPAAPFASGASYKVCFVPNGASCQDLLVDEINNTRRSLLIQAYSFTSAPIASAVKRAKDRGVDVHVILDKSQVSQRYSSATFLRNAGIPVVIDTRPAIAHNKIMVFDNASVFTGSFNFTRSAEERNAENGFLVRGDEKIVKAYVDNWNERFRVSTPY